MKCILFLDAGSFTISETEPIRTWIIGVGILFSQINWYITLESGVTPD